MRIITIMIILIVSSASLIAFHVVEHEKNHVQIYKLAGVESEVTYGLISTTKATNYIGQDLTNLELAQAQIEIIGYQIGTFLIIICFLIILLIISVFYVADEIITELKNNNKRMGGWELMDNVTILAILVLLFSLIISWLMYSVCNLKDEIKKLKGSENGWLIKTGL